VKIFIVKSQILESVVGVNWEDRPIAAVNKFIKTHYNVIPNGAECEGTEFEGTWKHDLAEGTYLQRKFIV